MKKLIAAFLLTASGVLVWMPAPSFAQSSSDTLYVSALPPGNLNNVIAGDTTAAGERKDPNRVYVLQQTGSFDTTYFWTATINMLSNWNLTIVGKNNPVTGMPPVVEPYILADNSTPVRLTECRAGNISVKNIYFLDSRTDGLISAGDSRFFDGTPVGATLRIDHCVFDDFTRGQGALISYGGDTNSFYITNCEFRNIQAQADFQTPIMFAEDADTIECVNNTFFCIGQDAIWGNDWLGYLLFDHNTILGDAQIPLHIYQVDTATIENNIFYGTYAWGLDSNAIKSGGIGNDPPAVINFDSLLQFSEPPYNLTEAGRHIMVRNNAYYWPNGVDSTISAIDDTAKDYVVSPTWMDSLTTAMFSDHSVWPGLSESSNDNVDPGYSASITGPMVSSLDSFTVEHWDGTIATSPLWRQFITNPNSVFGPVKKNWASVQGYAVPENLAYSNASLQTMGSDGKPLGDLNWYPSLLAVNEPPEAIADKFTLSQNYPNPFNPSTEIKVVLNKPGAMSLRIYNILGQEVKVIDQGSKPEGSYTYNVNMDKYASGVYFYTLRQGSSMLTRKMILLK